MFKVGDLVRHNSTIWDCSDIGLIIDVHPTFTKLVIVQWNSGVVEEVNAGHLEEVCSK